MGRYKTLHYIVVCGEGVRCNSAGVGERQGGSCVADRAESWLMQHNNSAEASGGRESVAKLLGRK